MSKPVRLYVTTCDSYIEATRPFVHLVNKYWKPKPQIVIGGFTPPKFDYPDNVTFHSIGKQEDYPFSKWSNAVAKMVLDLGDDVFALMLEDMWITRGVDGRAVQMLADYMHQFEYVGRIDLTGDRLYAHGMRDYGAVEHLDLIVSMPGSPYHLSLMPGLWRKDTLLRSMSPDWNPWEVELQGTTVLSHMREYIVLGTRQWPVRNILAFRGGDEQKLMVDGLQQVDIDDMRRLGYFSKWE